MNEAGCGVCPAEVPVSNPRGEAAALSVLWKASCSKQGLEKPLYLEMEKRRDRLLMPF